jgi:hypothetical protein
MTFYLSAERGQPQGWLVGTTCSRGSTSCRRGRKHPQRQRRHTLLTGSAGPALLSLPVLDDWEGSSADLRVFTTSTVPGAQETTAVVEPSSSGRFDQFLYLLRSPPSCVCACARVRAQYLCAFGSVATQARRR